MAISVVNLALNASGIAADISPFGADMRNITFFDQAKLEAFGTSIFDNLSGGSRIFNGLPVFSSAVMSANVEQSSKICDHPIESGAMVSDHKFRNPVRINCAIVMPSLLPDRVIDQLNEYYQSNDKIVIQTPTGIYRNMIIESMPSQMTPQNVSRPTFNIVFREVMIVYPDYADLQSDAANPADSDTKNAGVFSSAINKIKGAANSALDWLGSY